MDKKTLPIVIALAVIIIFYYPILQFFGLTEKPVPQVTPTEQADTNQSATPADTSISIIESTPITSDNLSAKTSADTAMSVESDTIIIKTKKYEIALSSHGGGPVSQYLKEFTYRDGRNINMLSKANLATPDFTFAGETFSTSGVDFSSSSRAGTYDVTSGPFDLHYSYKRGEGGGELIKHYRFYPDTYHYDLIIEIVNREQFGFERNYSVVWNTPLDVTEPQIQEDFAEVNAVALMAGSRVTLDDFEENKLKQSFDGQVSWAGVRTKYFTSAIIPRNSAVERVFASGKKMDVPIPDGVVEGREITVGLMMPLEGQLSDTFTIFVGPLDYNLMASYDVELEDMLGIGTTPYVGWIIKPFALAIIWLLPKMYYVIPNYGVVIIIFALLVKLITLPLSLKSFKSMQAMKDLQPKTEELKKKHKNNPQAMNQEMMKMYKEHGVNPMSGCLPILPQMPLFFALFSVFRSTILLRDAPFVWFVDDLSRGASSFTDPYIILVLIMIAAQFISQKFTMAPSQQNKILLYIMPLFMGFIFYSFAAGLVLYWACFSLFSLLDYAMFKRPKNQEVKTI